MQTQLTRPHKSKKTSFNSAVGKLTHLFGELFVWVKGIIPSREKYETTIMDFTIKPLEIAKNLYVRDRDVGDQKIFPCISL